MYSEISSISETFRNKTHVYIHTFLLRMTDTVTYQNIDLSSWDMLYVRLSWDFRRISRKKYEGPVCRLEVCVMQVAGLATVRQPWPRSRCPRNKQHSNLQIADHRNSPQGVLLQNQFWYLIESCSKALHELSSSYGSSTALYCHFMFMAVSS
jgi:hypothetical protein